MEHEDLEKSVNEYTQLNTAIISEPGIYARILLEMDINKQWKYEGFHQDLSQKQMSLNLRRI